MPLIFYGKQADATFWDAFKTFQTAMGVKSK